MYEVSITADFSAAHNLREVGGKCESLHGHNFKVEVGVEAEALDAHGMVVDFRLLKEKTRAFLERMDHRCLNDLPVFKDRNPSAENLARHILDGLAREIDGESRRVAWVAVWETENSRALYRRPPK